MRCCDPRGYGRCDVSQTHRGLGAPYHTDLTAVGQRVRAILPQAIPLAVAPGRFPAVAGNRYHALWPGIDGREQVKRKTQRIRRTGREFHRLPATRRASNARSDGCRQA